MLLIGQQKLPWFFVVQDGSAVSVVVTRFCTWAYMFGWRAKLDDEEEEIAFLDRSLNMVFSWALLRMGLMEIGDAVGGSVRFDWCLWFTVDWNEIYEKVSNEEKCEYHHHHHLRSFALCMLEVGFVLSRRSEVVNLHTSHLVSVSRQTEGPPCYEEIICATAFE